ncbi:predicted protein [Chaetoceros tenuissimus]|uniref:Uncharacterized protein n=1 Tax=Chaetoceros tenuissimus TaxID=426638 RepID=A0AAD3CI85_9STRA|nr:predicted protein [Chaetoceros tenuissimus]
MIQILTQIRNVVKDTTIIPKIKATTISPASGHDSLSSETIVACYQSAPNRCSLLFYRVNQDPSSKRDLELVKSRFIQFPSFIQTFAFHKCELRSEDKGNNSRFDQTILMAIGQNGILYKSPNLEDILNMSIHDSVPTGECTWNKSIDLLSIDSITSSSIQCPKLSNAEHTSKRRRNWMVMAGRYSLSPPMIVENSNDVMVAIDVDGLEDVNSKLTSVGIVHNRKDSKLWGSLKSLWIGRNENKYDEILWDSIDSSVVLFGYADGSVHACVVKCISENNVLRTSVSHAVQLQYPCAAFGSIISICVVHDKFLTCIGSFGKILVLNSKCLQLASKLDGAPIDMGAIANVESYSITVKNDVETGLLVISNSGDSYTVKISSDSSNEIIFVRSSKVPMKVDIASVSTILVNLSGKQKTFLFCLSKNFGLYCLSLLLDREGDTTQNIGISTAKSKRDATLDDTKESQSNKMKKLQHDIATTRAMINTVTSQSSIASTSNEEISAKMESKQRVRLKCATKSIKQENENLRQADTFHFQQYIPAQYVASNVIKNPCNALGSAQVEIDGVKKELNVYHGGTAQSYSFASGTPNREVIAHIWSLHKYLTFRSSTVTVSSEMDKHDRNPFQSEDGVTFPHTFCQEKSLPFLETLEKIHVPPDVGEDVVRSHINDFYAMNYVQDASILKSMTISHHNSKQCPSSKRSPNQLFYSSSSMSVELKSVEGLIDTDSLYLGFGIGMNCVIALRLEVAEKGSADNMTQNEEVLLHIWCASSAEESLNGHSLVVKTLLKEILSEKGQMHFESGIGLKDEREKEKYRRVLNKIISRMIDDEELRSQHCLEIYKKMRSI